MDDATFVRNMARRGRVILLADGSAVPVPTSVVDDPNMAGGAFRIQLVSPEEIESGDRRTFRAGTIDNRDLPLPLMWQYALDDGHTGAVIVGRIDYIERVDGGLGNARGVFDVGPWGREAERMVRAKMLRGVSGDYSNFAADVLEKIEDSDNKILDDKVSVRASKLVSATLVSKPAFEGCIIEIVDEDLDRLALDEDEVDLPDGIIEQVIPITASVAAASGLTDLVLRLQRLEMAEQQLQDEELALVASAARERVTAHRLTRERDDAIARVRAARQITAAWKPMSSKFLSAKAKLQPRDTRGRWIEIGSVVRWNNGSESGAGRKDKKKYSIGRVTGFDASTGNYTVHSTGDGSSSRTVQLKGKDIEVVKAAIPSSPDEAKRLSNSTDSIINDTGAKLNAPTPAPAPVGRLEDEADVKLRVDGTIVPPTELEKGDRFRLKDSATPYNFESYDPGWKSVTGTDDDGNKKSWTNVESVEKLPSEDGDAKSPETPDAVRTPDAAPSDVTPDAPEVPEAPEDIVQPAPDSTPEVQRAVQSINVLLAQNFREPYPNAPDSPDIGEPDAPSRGERRQAKRDAKDVVRQAEDARLWPPKDVLGRQLFANLARPNETWEKDGEKYVRAADMLKSVATSRFLSKKRREWLQNTYGKGAPQLYDDRARSQNFIDPQAYNMFHSVGETNWSNEAGPLAAALAGPSPSQNFNTPQQDAVSVLGKNTVDAIKAKNAPTPSPDAPPGTTKVGEYDVDSNGVVHLKQGQSISLTSPPNVQPAPNQPSSDSPDAPSSSSDLDGKVQNFLSVLDDVNGGSTDGINERLTEITDESGTRDELQFDGLQSEIDDIKASSTDADAEKLQNALDELKATAIDGSSSDLYVPDDLTSPARKLQDLAKTMFENLNPGSSWDEADQTAWIDAAKKALETRND